jgi:hypothetical protein
MPLGIFQLKWKQNGTIKANSMFVLANSFSRLPCFDSSIPEKRKDELWMDQVPFDPEAPRGLAKEYQEQ